jgi:hypothetical protein
MTYRSCYFCAGPYTDSSLAVSGGFFVPLTWRRLTLRLRYVRAKHSFRRNLSQGRLQHGGMCGQDLMCDVRQLVFKIIIGTMYKINVPEAYDYGKLFTR